MWKRLTDGRDIDPDFYVEEGEDAVYEESAIARRVFGWKGRMFPRISVAAYKQWGDEKPTCLKGRPGFKISCAYKSDQGQWWRDIDVPLDLLDELVDMLGNVKMKLSTSGEGK